MSPLSREERILVDMYDQPGRFAALERYWSDPAERARIEAERVVGQAKIDALFSNHTARVRAEMEARWAEEGEK